MTREVFSYDPPPPFERAAPEQPAARIGDGEIGGKAAGLMSARTLLASHFPHERFPELDVDVPHFTVLATGVFDAFMQKNGLPDVAATDVTDERIAHAFQRHDMPFEFVGDLRALTDRVHAPIAVRSSSMLEDRLAHPFAGVYETKMIPNDQPDPDARFQKLVEAVKYVYASMYFRGARSYLKTIGRTLEDEKMAVVLQEVVGLRHGERFYPHVSGVAKSYNYYAFGRAKPPDGVVSLALGLGKTIVDGGRCWSYCPLYPKVPPPFASARDQLRQTQSEFWAVNMGTPPAFDPTSETEYIVQLGLDAADYDGVLRWVASTYDGAADRMLPGLRGSGPRVLNFAPVLEYDEFPVNELVRTLLSMCEETFGTEVEVEFALTFSTPTSRRARLGFLQVRPMAGVGDRVDLPDAAPAGQTTLVASDRVMGNGVVDTIRDVVYVKPAAFELRHSEATAVHLDTINQHLLEQGTPYLLIGFGRWGSSDPWLGIPVAWSQICQARAIVEAAVEGVRVDPSQGSHFFHNVSSFGVSYFTVREGDEKIDWAWLDGHEASWESEFVRHVRLAHPLRVVVDGQVGRGAIYRSAGSQ